MIARVCFEGGIIPLGDRSAAKAWRQSQQRSLRNRARRTTAKTSVRRAELTMASADPQASAEAVRIAISALDRAGRKGALHSKSVARRKGRLMKRYNAVQVAAIVAEEEAAPVRKRRTKKKEATAREVPKKGRPSKKKEK
jgi:small subunit ribosomal protein S20